MKGKNEMNSKLTIFVTFCATPLTMKGVAKKAIIRPTSLAETMNQSKLSTVKSSFSNQQSLCQIVHKTDDLALLDPPEKCRLWILFGW